jgi:hypothetical protein
MAAEKDKTHTIKAWHDVIKDPLSFVVTCGERIVCVLGCRRLDSADGLCWIHFVEAESKDLKQLLKRLKHRVAALHVHGYAQLHALVSDHLPEGHGLARFFKFKEEAKAHGHTSYRRRLK